ncbi:putative Alpha N-terminal protein methyltransferase 1 [Glarea lozoyensis 74030]|uniref:Alpha N-terminal protein methyltransferase 1 n=1 Tax=Glarea lozoyensis (strain ATCC 74030 / MF5533) TaxID=1104152 RepID=H0ECP2_GLAL7|nr:putative Alpha N-terminal protein methyltransferase 1 [Glarea lozoyensis 74030]
MLGGGFPYVSKVDLLGSRAFLRKIGVVGGSVKEVGRAVDCGAGIGRITSGLLLSIAKTVDIVEPISKFTDALSGTPGIGQIFNTGLESWTPSPEPGYDIVWNQWCLGHLTDDQLVNYLNKCRSALTERGLVIVKENLSSSGHDLFDEVDSSVTRTTAGTFKTKCHHNIEAKYAVFYYLGSHLGQASLSSKTSLVSAETKLQG